MPERTSGAYRLAKATASATTSSHAANRFSDESLFI